MNFSPLRRSNPRLSSVAHRRVRRCSLAVGQLEGRLLLAADLTAPTTSAAVVAGHLGDNNTYTAPISIRLQATDPDDAASSLRTFYRVDNGPTLQGNSLTLGDGAHTVSFFSVDAAGNVEATQSRTFNVDATAPVVTASASPSSLFPPNHKFLPVTVTGHVTDASGGVPATVRYQVADSSGNVQPAGTAAVDANGNYTFVVPLQSSRSGRDRNGRTYTITVTATDLAGNAGSAMTTVNVPHDQGHHSGGGNSGHGHGNQGHHSGGGNSGHGHGNQGHHSGGGNSGHGRGNQGDGGQNQGHHGHNQGDHGRNDNGTNTGMAGQTDESGGNQGGLNGGSGRRNDG